MKAEIRTAFPLISLKTKISLFSSIFFQLFETYFHLYFKTTFCQYYFYMVPDIESDKKNGLCRAVHTAHTRPTQIPTRFCANLSISESCLYIRLGVGQGEHTITNLTAVKKKTNLCYFKFFNYKNLHFYFSSLSWKIQNSLENKIHFSNVGGGNPAEKISDNHYMTKHDLIPHFSKR